MVAVPNWLAAGITFTVRCEPLGSVALSGFVMMMFASGISVVFEEVLAIASVSSLSSSSVTSKVISPVPSAVSSSMLG